MMRLKKEKHRHCKACGKKITSVCDLVKVVATLIPENGPGVFAVRRVSWYCQRCWEGRSIGEAKKAMVATGPPGRGLELL